MAGVMRTTLLRGTAALAVLALPVAVVVGGERLRPWAPVEQPAASVEVDAPATDLVCPSPVRLATEDSADAGSAVDPQFDPAPVASVATLSALSAATGTTPATAELRTLGSAAPLAELPGSGVAAVVEIPEPEVAAVVHADGGQDRPAALAGSVVTRTSAGDLRGLVAAACRPASGEVWLVGGSTSVESSARLVLQNPGQTPATVSIAVWGPTGPVDLTTAPELLVPGGAERSVLLEGLAVEQPRIVVRVTATGGTVSAYLQDSAIDGLVPAGVTDVVAGEEPTTRQVVAGVVVAGGNADPAVLRLLAPGLADGTAHVSVLGAEGATTLPGADALSLTAGGVLDVPLGGLAAGSYTLVVDADVPVVAGAMLARGLGLVAPGGATTPVDRAWVASMPSGAGDLVALPALAGWTLSLALPPDAAGESAAVAVEVLGPNGAVLTTAERTVRPGESLSLSADELIGTGSTASGVVVSSDGDVAWSVVLEVPDEAGDLVAVLGPVAVPSARSTVTVRLG